MSKIFIKKQETGVNIPSRGTEVSAGYDIIATSDPKIVGTKYNSDGSGDFWKSIDYIEYETNLHITPEFKDIHTLIHPRSSISKYNLVLANSIGLVDNDYTGMVLCRFKYQWQPIDFIYVPTSDGNVSAISALIVGKPDMSKLYKKGDKIVQLMFEKTIHVEFELVDELPESKRGSGGFGSTDNVAKKSLAPTQNLIPQRSTLADKYITDGAPRNRSGYEEVQKASGNILKKYNESGGVEIKPSYSEELKRRNLNS